MLYFSFPITKTPITMKKVFLKSLTCLLFLATMISCSTDSTTQEPSNKSTTNSINKKSNSIWEGVIGIEEYGKYKITADEKALMSYLEYLMDQEGDDVTLEEINIVKQTATNDPTDTAYLLIASGRSGGGGLPEAVNIGLVLAKEQNTFYIGAGLDTGDPIIVTSCRGCSYGCNLRYYTIGKHQVPYCDENGCSRYNCTKRERPL